MKSCGEDDDNDEEEEERKPRKEKFSCHLMIVSLRKRGEKSE